MSLSDPSTSLPSVFMIFAIAFWILEKGIVAAILVYLYKTYKTYKTYNTLNIKK